MPSLPAHPARGSVDGQDVSAVKSPADTHGYASMSLGFETCHSRSQCPWGCAAAVECREPSSLGESFSQEMGGWDRAQSLTAVVFSGRDQRLGCLFTILQGLGTGLHSELMLPQAWERIYSCCDVGGVRGISPEVKPVEFSHLPSCRTLKVALKYHKQKECPIYFSRRLLQLPAEGPSLFLCPKGLSSVLEVSSMQFSPTSQGKSDFLCFFSC